MSAHANRRSERQGTVNKRAHRAVLQARALRHLQVPHVRRPVDAVHLELRLSARRRMRAVGLSELHPKAVDELVTRLVRDVSGIVAGAGRVAAVGHNRHPLAGRRRSSKSGARWPCFKMHRPLRAPHGQYQASPTGCHQPWQRCCQVPYIRSRLRLPPPPHGQSPLLYHPARVRATRPRAATKRPDGCHPLSPVVVPDCGVPGRWQWYMIRDSLERPCRVP